MTKWFEGFTSAEWRVLNLSFVFMMICAFLLSNERVLGRLTFARSGNALSVMGELHTASGDLRVKSAAGEWRSGTGPLYLGEAVVAGRDGRATVRLRPGVELQMHPESLLRLALIEGVPLMDLLAGRFSWSVSGEFELAVKGERALLRGQPAEIEVLVGPGLAEPVVKTMTGRGNFQFRRSIAGPQDAQAPVAAPMPNPVYFYVWQLGDFYLVDNQRVARAGATPVQVRLDLVVNWEHSAQQGPFTVQLSSSPEFSNVKDFFTTADQTHTLEKVFLGENFWRVSFEDFYWSQVQTFKVEPRFLELALKAKPGGGAEWEPSETMAGYIAEVSPSEDFAPENSEFKWLAGPRYPLDPGGRGPLFVRIRGINGRNQISDWSQPVKVNR
jgi:hypothetical protein